MRQTKIVLKEQMD